jgi:hypothetical protein
VRRLITGLGLLLLVSAMPACLLYTDRINRPPTVAIEPPTELHPGSQAVFKAKGSDPDGDAVTFRWSRIDKPCTGRPEEWAGAPISMGESMDMVPGHGTFCLHLVAQDSAGAETMAEHFCQPANRPPVVPIDVTAPTLAGAEYPLYTFFSLSSGRTTDLDGDDLTYGWEVRDPAGMPVPPEPCPGGPSPTMRCFHAEVPGTFVATAAAMDGWGEGHGTLSLRVAEDQPPCIEATEPTIDIAAVVLAVTDPPRRFEVRRVRDDGHPYPPAGPRATTFRWFTASATGAWTRQLGYEAATFDVSAARFEDARPGSVFRVRVEARDPAHDSQADLRELESCGEDRVCERPAGCVRWVGWKVQLQ